MGKTLLKTDTTPCRAGDGTDSGRALTFAGVAHAQGTMAVSGTQTVRGTFKTIAIYACAVICFGGLIFAGIRMMSGRFQDAIPGLFGALFGAGVLGWGAGWMGNLTGQSM